MYHVLHVARASTHCSLTVGFLEGRVGGFARENRPALVGDQRCLMLVLATLRTTIVGQRALQINGNPNNALADGLCWAELVEWWGCRIILCQMAIVVVATCCLIRYPTHSRSLAQYDDAESRQRVT